MMQSVYVFFAVKLEQAVLETVDLPVILDTNTLMWSHCADNMGALY